MRTLVSPLILIAFVLPAHGLDLNPIAKMTWQLWGRTAPTGGLDTRQGDRAVVVFDLSGVDLATLRTATLSVMAVQEGNWGLTIEALSRPNASALDLEPPRESRRLS